MRPGRRRLLVVSLVAAVLAATAIVVAAATGPGSGGDPTRTAAARRPAASLFLAPDGDDDGPCTRGRPCRTLQAAGDRARGDDVVELAGGDYGEQSLARLPRARAGARVVFRSAAGARPRLQRLTLQPEVAHVELQELDFPGGWEAGPSPSGPPAEDLVFRGTTGSRFSIENASHVAILGGSYGPAVDETPQIKVYEPGAPAGPRDVLVAGVRFHDFTRSSEDVHTECLQIYAGERIVLRGNRFTTCDGTGDLALTTLGSTRLRDVRVEDNFFDARGDAVYAMQADESVEHLVLRYNSALASVAFTACTKAICGSAEVTANVMPFNPALCSARATFRGNVLTGGRCSPRDVRVRELGFVAPDRFDLHLTAGSPAVCRGVRDAAPARDIDGQRRSRRRVPDAGADQLPDRTRGLPARCGL